MHHATAIRRATPYLALLFSFTLAACDDRPLGPNQDAGPAAHFYGVDAVNRLVTFDLAALGSTSSIPLTGLEAGETVLGMDARPSTGVVYLLGSTSRVYTVNLETGACLQLGGQLSSLVTGNAVGFDFNPVADRIRVQSVNAENFRLDPTTGAITGTDTALTFLSGDVNQAATPQIAGDAYTIPGDAGTTVLYAIDANLDVLTMSPNPNSGMLTTIGPLGVNVTSSVGFDIAQTATGDVAYAVMSPGALVSTLYTINLTTGAATAVGTIGGAQLVAFTYVP